MVSFRLQCLCITDLSPCSLVIQHIQLAQLMTNPDLQTESETTLHNIVSSFATQATECDKICANSLIEVALINSSFPVLFILVAMSLFQTCPQFQFKQNGIVQIILTVMQTSNLVRLAESQSAREPT